MQYGGRHSVSNRVLGSTRRVRQSPNSTPGGLLLGLITAYHNTPKNYSAVYWIFCEKCGYVAAHKQRFHRIIVQMGAEYSEKTDKLREKTV